MTLSIIAAVLGMLFGLLSRFWLSIDGGRGRTINLEDESHPRRRGIRVNVIVGIGNTINYNMARSVSQSPALSTPPHQESPDAKSA
jgi:hypothetical protein